MTSSGGDDVINDVEILSEGVNSYLVHTCKISWKNIKFIKSYQKFSFINARRVKVFAQLLRSFEKGL